MSDDFFDGDWSLEEASTNLPNTELDVSVSFEGFKVGSGADSAVAGGTTTPSTPSSPTVPPTPAGAIEFPEDDDRFMQTLEVRGINGHGEPVETVYAIVLFEGRAPRLVALHDPEMYINATRRSVRYYIEPMAAEVARQCNGTTPDAVVKVHTHPGGSTTPSEKDKEGTQTTMRAFQDAIGSRDFRFLQGIHAYQSAKVAADKMRVPTAGGNSVSWNGENHRHTLALFGAHFNKRPEVNVV